jgi:hypothetical protein
MEEIPQEIVCATYDDIRNFRPKPVDVTLSSVCLPVLCDGIILAPGPNVQRASLNTDLMNRLEALSFSE